MNDTDRQTDNLEEDVQNSKDDTKKRIPKEVAILPLRNVVAFPYTILPLTIGVPRSVQLIEDAQKGDRFIGLVSMKDPEIEEPAAGQVYETGTLARIERVIEMPDKNFQVMVRGLERIRIDHWLTETPYLQARIRLAPDVVEQGLPGSFHFPPV